MSPKHPLGIGRKLLFGFTTIVMVMAGLASPANVRAAAETCGPISNGVAAGFAIDGKVLCSSSGIDWYKLPASSCLGVLDSPPGVCGNPIAGLGNTLFLEDSVGPSTGNDPTVFSGMSNANQDLIGAGQNPWHWKAGTVPQKDDLTEAYINVRPAAADPNGDIWLIVGAAYRSTDGDKHFDFEFNQKGLNLNPDGTITGNGTDGGRTSGTSGDIVLSIDYQQGGAAPCVHLRQWRAVGGSFAYVQVNAQCPPLPGGPPRDTSFSAVSVANTAVPCLVFANSPQESRTDHYDALQFAEGAVNLSCYLPGFNVGAFCNTISTVQIKTRSSGSSGFANAQLKDFAIAPFALSTPPVANAGPDRSQCANVAGSNSFDLSGSCSSGNCGWSQVSGPAVTFGDASQCATTASFTGPGVAILKLTCTAQAGCEATDQVSLTVNANPVVSETHTNVKCFNGSDGSINVTVSGGMPPYSFLWADGPTTQNRTGLAAGSYSVTVTDANGCTGTTGATITQPALLTASATHVDVKCNGGNDGSIDVTVSGGTTPYSFKWADGPTTEDRSGLAAGSYSVTVTDANGCTASTGATIGQASSLSASETHTDVKCFDGSDGSIDVTVSGGTSPYSFKWADGPTTEDRSGLAAGSYSVTVTDANGCTATTGATITQPTLLTASQTHNDVKCFNGSDGSIDVTVSGGTSPYSFAWADGPTTEDRSGLAAGSYSVTVTDANGCTATTGATITQPAQLLASATHVDVKCFNGSDGSIDVTVSGGTSPYSFAWADGPTTEDRSGLAAGSYSVTVTDANGCTATAGATIAQPTQLTASATKTDVTCQGGQGSIDVTVTGGTTPYSFKWADGPTTEDRSNLAAGTYSVTVTDANGCTATTGATISQPFCGKIAPTMTTCSDFTSGTSGTITQLCFGLKSGKINNVAPGVFFYFTTVKSQVNGSFTVNITQTDSPAFAFFDVQNGQVTVYNATCNNYANATLNSFAGGQVSVTINGASIGQVFIIQVKYSANSVVGQNANKNTLIHYDFTTYIGGVAVDAAAGGLDLKNCVGGATPALASAGSGSENSASANSGSENSASENSASENSGIEFYRPTPNPFFDTMRMAYAVAGTGERVQIGVYDLAGRRVRSMVSAFQPAGRYEVSWNGQGDDGIRVHDGVYFIHTVIANSVRTMRIAYLH